MPVRSASSIIHEFLGKQVEGFTFTTKSLLKNAAFADWPQITEGAISGFMSRAISYGVLEYSDSGRTRTFVFAHPDKLKDMPYRESAGAGSMPGRSNANYHTRRRPTAESLAERIMQIAADVELLQPSLSTVSTKDLLAELERRTTERQVV